MTSGRILDVTCPFCGLICDDLVVERAGGRLTPEGLGCSLARAAYARLPEPPEHAARIAGRPASLAEAAAEAARILAAARLPVIGGLGTDVAGVRAASRLAERCGAVLDHVNSPAAMRNVLTVQDSGWITTTLSEIRNRADLLLIVGSDLGARFPRFIERCVANRDTLFGDARRCDILCLGCDPPPGAPEATVVPCPRERLAEVFGVLRAVLAGRPLGATAVAGRPLAEWEQLARRLKAARYGVAVWAAADLDLAHGELTVQALSELLKDLNRETRFSGLPLSGTDGDFTADTVLQWQSGYGTRTGFGRGVPEHDPHLFSATRLLARGEADALVWLASIDASRVPPAAAVPTIVVGRPDLVPAAEPAVFIATGIPGVDHAAHLFRTDRVVALPLAGLRPSPLPSAAEALAAIEAALPVAAC